MVSSRATYTLGVSLKVPVFDGGRREARRGERLLAIQAGADSHARSSDQQIELQVRMALESLRSAAAEVDAAREG